MLNKILDGIRGTSDLRHGRPRIVFLHLPRTGGTALAKDILFRNFPRSRWCHVNYDHDLRPQAGADDPLRWTAARRSRIQVLAGHMPLGLAEHFPGRSESVTMLRNPIKRTVSDYCYCHRNPANAAHEMARKLSLVEFVERGYGLTHNCYARWLSNAIYGTRFSTEDEMLEAARKNLGTFTLVGITEWFEMSVRRICERYQLTEGPLSAVNRNDETSKEIQISAEERRVIVRCNELDGLIYEEARVRFRNDTARMAVDRGGTDTLEQPAYT